MDIWNKIQTIMEYEIHCRPTCTLSHNIKSVFFYAPAPARDIISSPFSRSDGTARRSLRENGNDLIDDKIVLIQSILCFILKM